MLKEHIKELCEELEIREIPKPNEKNIYSFEVVKGVPIEMKDLNPGVFLKGKIDECMKEKREDLFIALMQANLLGQGTGGAAIGLDGDEKFLTLSLALPYEMNYRAFREYLEDFVNYLLYWRSYIQKAKEEAGRLI